MKSRVTRWGNSLGVRIPKSLAQESGLTEGTPIVFEVEDDAIIIRRKRYSLEKLLSQVTPKNLHGETDIGPPVRREIW